MIRNTTRIFLVTSILVMALAFTAHAQPVTVQFWHFYGPGNAEGDMIQWAVDEFNRRYEGQIVVEPTIVGFGEMHDKYPIAMAAGIAPDVVIWNLDYVQAPLPMIPRGPSWRSRWSTPALTMRRPTPTSPAGARSWTRSLRPSACPSRRGQLSKTPSASSPASSRRSVHGSGSAGTKRHRNVLLPERAQPGSNGLLVIVRIVPGSCAVSSEALGHRLIKRIFKRDFLQSGRVISCSFCRESKRRQPYVTGGMPF